MSFQGHAVSDANVFTTSNVCASDIITDCGESKVRLWSFIQWCNIHKRVFRETR
jgi:hypothetical protein